MPRRRDLVFFEGNERLGAAALAGHALASVVDENAPHELGRDPEEVFAVLPLDTLLPH